MGQYARQSLKNKSKAFQVCMRFWSYSISVPSRIIFGGWVEKLEVYITPPCYDLQRKILALTEKKKKNYSYYY